MSGERASSLAAGAPGVPSGTRGVAPGRPAARRTPETGHESLEGPDPMPAFVFENDDRLRYVMVTSPQCSRSEPDASVLVQVFVVRRKLGPFIHYDIYAILRTSVRDECVGRKVSVVSGIPRRDLRAQMRLARERMADAVKQACGQEPEWETLDLSSIPARRSQEAMILAWGRISLPFGRNFIPELPPLVRRRSGRQSDRPTKAPG
jgi:hypothetical protein